MASSSRTIPKQSLDMRRCLVPQTLYQVYTIDFGPDLPIMCYAPPGVPGIPMDQLLSADKTTLRKMIPIYDDSRILTLLLPSITLRIMWPGYEHMNFHRKIYLSAPGVGGVGCAGELAVAIADTYAGFLKQAAFCRPQGDRRDWFLTRESAFTLSDLGLVAVRHMGSDIFQADIELRTWRAGIPYASLAAPSIACMPPPGSMGRELNSLALPTPAPVRVHEQEPQSNAEISSKPTLEQQAYFRDVYMRDPEAYMQKVEAFARHIGHGTTAEAIMNWSLNSRSAEEDLPGPTGGLMYP